MSKSQKFLLVWVLPSFFLLFVLAFLFIPEPNHESDEDLVAFANQYLDGVKACEVYAQLIHRHPLESEYQLRFAEGWSQSDAKRRIFLKHELTEQGLFPVTSYKLNSRSGDDAFRNSGYFGLATFEYFNNRYFESNAYLDSISNETHPGMEYLYGLLDNIKGKSSSACEHYQQEINNNGLVDYTWARILPCKGEAGIEILADLEKRKENAHVPHFYRRTLQIRHGGLAGYLKSVVQTFTQQINPHGTGAAFVVVLIWFFYLFRLNRLANVSLQMQLTAIIGGALSVFLVTVLNDLSRLAFEIQYSGTFFNEIKNSFIRIGFIEETVKLLPVAILAIAFKRKFSSPMAYLAAASLSGLGFTVMEDSLYFQSTDLDIISSRTLKTGCLHMAWTSIAVYGFIQYKFRPGITNRWVSSIGFYLLAIFFHGLYDIWLLNGSYYLLRFVSIIVVVVSTVIWVAILNNALNNSGSFTRRKALDIDRLSAQLIALFCGIIFIEFFINSLIFGPTQSSAVLLNGAKTGLYIIPFLAYSLSRIDLAPGGWTHLDVSIQKKIQNIDSIIDHRFRINAYRNFGPIANLLPMNGLITQRITIQNDNNWFVFVPDEKHIKDRPEVAALLIKGKSIGASLLRKNVIVYVRVVPHLDLIKSQNVELKSFRFIDWGMMNPQSS